MKLDTSTDPQVGYRPAGSLDLASALQPYDGHWGPRQAAHLARRAGFGPTPAEIDRSVAAGMAGSVATLLHPTNEEVAFPAYPDTTALLDVHKRTVTAQMWWLDRMLRTKRPLLEKMTLFWHGHFATSTNKVEARYMCEQIDLFRSMALGNFRSLLIATAQNPAMLIWLDNRQNVAAHPNENFAREVMELFTLGLGAYTEDDVHAAARAFTGWGLDKAARFAFHPAQHDPASKTFLGRTGTFDGTDIIDIIVQQPVHTRFLAHKLLEFFVYSDPEPELIDAVADVYARSGTNVAQVVGALLRSNVFYSSRAYRALPKSPIEFTVGLLRYMDVAQTPADIPYWLQRMGQAPLAPPSVKGWDGGPTWINTATLLSRFNLVNKVVKSSPPRLSAPPVLAATSMTGVPAMAGAPAPAVVAPGTTTAGAVTAVPGVPAAAQSAKLAAMPGAAGAAPMAAVPPKTTPPPAPPPPLATFPAYTPDVVVAAAGGLDAGRVLATLLAGAVQNDVTSDVRRTLIAYLQSENATLPTPFGAENYQEKIRGVLALVLNLPSNQLN